ncbi:MAG: hypothetical protein ACKOXP_07235 [Flavobacteriales bacterium]
MENCFVFVVCGGKEHLETLHFSLEYLLKRTSNQVFVLTDSSRNVIPINHSMLIDVKCPEHYDHHQASIYLKTGIHQFLPKGNRYCYLDTDVVAIGDHVDDIFSAYLSPITFAPDHCVVNEFSAYAVNCACLNKWESNWERYHRAFEELNQNKSIPKENISKQKDLREVFQEMNGNYWKMFIQFFRYLISYPVFHLNDEFYFNRKTRLWSHVMLGPVLHETPNKEIAKRSGLHYHSLTKKWSDEHGDPLWNPTCTHLISNLNDKLKVHVSKERWQHWNGGVFLFDDESYEFLQTWHEWTLACFEDSRFKTRDQGTLIATVWHFGLQNHPTLSKKWNLLADYHSEKLRFHSEAEGFSWIGEKEIVFPEFVHVYHHWQDDQWEVWNWLLGKK